MRTTLRSSEVEQYAEASLPYSAESESEIELLRAAVAQVVSEGARAPDRIIAELSGFGMSADAYHMTAPPADGEGAARCMKIALQDAGLGAGQIDYINAHGTSTLLGDRAESDAVKTVFGDHAHRLAVSSTKSMTGHMLGAAGGSEAVFTALAIRDNIAPPTINLDTPGEGCDLDYVPNTAREKPCRHVMNSNMGFGGQNAVLIVSRYDGKLP